MDDMGSIMGDIVFIFIVVAPLALCAGKAGIIWLLTATGCLTLMMLFPRVLAFVFGKDIMKDVMLALFGSGAVFLVVLFGGIILCTLWDRLKNSLLAEKDNDGKEPPRGQASGLLMTGA